MAARPRPRPGQGTTTRRPGSRGYRDRGGTTPVQFDPDTGVIIGDTPPGFYPPGFVPDPDNPGMMQRPGAPGYNTVPSFPGRGTNVPARPPQGHIPVPGLPPGQLPPPPGAVPSPGGGYNYEIPGTPGTAPSLPPGGRPSQLEPGTPGTPGSGPIPMPVDPNYRQPDYGPPLPPNYPGNFWPSFPDRFEPPPNIPDRAFIEDYIKNYDPNGPFINPEQLFDYDTPTAEDIPGFSIFDIPGAKAKGAEIIEDRINDSIWRNRIDPFIDRTLMDGIGGILEGFDPNFGWPEDVPAVPPRQATIPGTNIPLNNPITGNPIMRPGSPATTRPGPPPILDPRNYPGMFGDGGGGGGFPSLGDIGDFIGDQFTPMPTPGAPYPPAPPMPRNIPPMGGGARGPMPGQMPGQFPGQMPGGFQPTMQQRPMFP